MITYQEENNVYQSSLINTLHGFGTKLTNYSQLLSASSVIRPKQTHSTNITVINSSEQSKQSIQDCDGIITKEPNMILTVETADCVPIIFYDNVSQIIGISHQGWKGTLHRLPAKMVKEMVKLGSKMENIHCAIGPAINDCCYEIYGERLTQFQDTFHTETIFRTQDQKLFLNLYIANYLTLSNSGIPFVNIDYFPFCTSCNTKQFWSYHRDKSTENEMVNFVMTRPKVS